MPLAIDDAALTVTGAAIGHRTAGLSIEDHAAVLLQGGGASCLVETGYLYPPRIPSSTCITASAARAIISPRAATLLWRSSPMTGSIRAAR